MSDSPDDVRPRKEDDTIKEKLSTMWFETRLGQRYELPDMLREHVTYAHEQVATSHHESTVIMINVSGVSLCIPKRIIAKAGVGERCFWEVE